MAHHTMAVIGYGGMGRWHCQNIREKVPDITVKGVWDIRPEAREKAQAEGFAPYENLQALLSDAQVELVTIAVPNNFHKELSISCLRAGKHVVCEKPVTMNARELEEIMAVAEETGKLFSVHHNRRWDKDYRIVRHILDGGSIGQPYFIESRVQGSRGAMYGWRGHKVNGGGMVLDWGVHLLDQMLELVPSPLISVDAHLQQVFSQEVEDNIKLFLRFQNGVSALLEMSTNCFVQLPRWHVSCTGGTLVVDGWDCGGKIVQLREDAAAMAWDNDIVYTAAGPTRTMAPRPAYTTREEPLPSVETDWADYYRNIVAAMDGQAELLVKPEQCLRVMRVIDLIFASQEQGHGMACFI